MFSHEDLTVLHCMSKFSPSDFKIQYKMFTCQELFFQVSFHFNRCRITVNTSLRSCHRFLPCSRSLLFSLPSAPLSCTGRERPRPSCCTLAPRIHSSSPTPSGKANNPIFNKARLRNLSSESAFLVLCISSYLRGAQPWSTDRLGDAGGKIIWVEIITKIYNDKDVDRVRECFWNFSSNKPRNRF